MARYCEATGKRKFLSHHEAFQARAEFYLSPRFQERAGKFTIYLCAVCAGWHLGNHKKKSRPAEMEKS